MGLSLFYATKDYECDGETDTYKGHCDLSFDIGYVGYKIFRDKLLEFATNGMANTDSLFINNVIKKSNKMIMFMDTEEQKDLLCYCWYNDDGYRVIMKKEDFTGEEITSEKQEYLDKIEKIKQISSNLYALYPFVFHSDCEGYMLKDQLVDVLPILKDFQSTEDSKENYPYKEFLESLIKTVEKVIETDGKLMFS